VFEHVSLHDALPILLAYTADVPVVLGARLVLVDPFLSGRSPPKYPANPPAAGAFPFIVLYRYQDHGNRFSQVVQREQGLRIHQRSEEHTSELQSRVE